MSATQRPFRACLKLCLRVQVPPACLHTPEGERPSILDSHLAEVMKAWGFAPTDAGDVFDALKLYEGSGEV